MSSIVNKVKDALHSDKDKNTTHDSHHTTHGTSTTHHANEPRVHDTTTTGVAGGVPGTHDNLTGGDHYTHGTTGTAGHTGGVNTLGGAGMGGAAFAGNNRGADGPAAKTDGPHKSDMMNKVDPRVDSDRDHSKNMGMNPQGSATTGAAGTTGHTTGHTTVGGERSAFGNTGVATGGAANTAAFDRGHTGPATRTDGPHSSNMMNQADPRVDSDRDASRNMGMNPHGTAGTGTTGGMGTMGTMGTTHASSTTGPATHTAGPHSSNMANKADPRVDSDRQDPAFFSGGAAGTGNAGTFGNTGREPLAPGAGAGIGAGAGTAGHHVGHNDPNLHTMGTTGTTGATGAHAVHGTHGAHTGTHTGAAGTHTTTHGGNLSHGAAPGPAPNTAGPHKSDMMNKVDPRVDSNLDGSKTVGGDKTAPLEHRDPTDATQVPPSVMQKHIGAPTVEHDDHTHDRERRHSVNTHQEQHRGL